jgi:hypothetical protein
MPTGLANSPGMNATTLGTPTIPRTAINQSHRLTFAATGVSQNFQPMHVPAGCSVYIRGNSTNVGVAYVAVNRETLAVGLGDPVTKDTEINYPVDNTGQIWAMGTAGDGLTVSIRGGTQAL